MWESNFEHIRCYKKYYSFANIYFKIPKYVPDADYVILED